MTGEEFTAWLAAMKAKGFNKQECGELLGRRPAWVSIAQTNGADRAVALACTALLRGLKPFTIETATPPRRKSAGQALA